MLIPTHLNTAGLRRALRCLRAQRGADWEAIVIDDGTGEGLTVAKSFGDGRIRAYRNPGCGLTAARNAGLEVARGAVIAWLRDADYWTDADYLSRLCQALRQGEALTYSGGALRRFDDDVKPQFHSPSVTLEVLRSTNPLLISGIAYPAVMHDWFGDFDASLELTWDWDWSLRLAQNGVPLRAIKGANISALIPQTLPNPAKWSRDLALLAHKHGLRDARIQNLWEVAPAQSGRLEPIAAD